MTPENKEICAIVPGNQDGLRPRVFGMGFLVSDREILTCAHVIVAVLGEDWLKGPGVVRICFPFIEGSNGGFLCMDGSVDRTRWLAPGPPLPNKPTDIAVVVLPQDAPPTVKRASLRQHEYKALVKIFGFREKPTGEENHPEGELLEGEILGELVGGRGQFDGIRETGATIEEGFSGAGVYDPKQDAIVGMIVAADVVKPRKIAQFIDVPSLLQALGRLVAVPQPVTVAGPPATSESLLFQTRDKMLEIESYLQDVAKILPQPDPDHGLLALLESIMFDSPDAAGLRAAFGFAAKPERLRSTFELVAAGESSMQPLLGIWAQRVEQALWRYWYTLDYIKSEWAAGAQQRVDELRTICFPHLPARQPTLRDISAVLVSGSKDLKAFTEYSPDATLYAVMRSFRSPRIDRNTNTDVLIGPEPESGPALEFLFKYIHDLDNGTRTIDDSSNAWWAVRIGICRKQKQFRDLLPVVANRFSDVTIPSEEVSRRAPMPEIYRAISTISYTLSNVQAIMQCNSGIDSGLKNQLHEVISVMLDRLLKTPRSKHLYLASVHHEGLRNYCDYVDDQKLPIT